MAAFGDSTGRPWALDINVGALKRVRSLLGADPLDAGFIASISADDEACANALYAICKPEADAAIVDDDDFGRRLADVLPAARAALLAAFVEFFPDQDEPRPASDGPPLAATPWQAIHALAGVAGVNPDGLTLRELVWMAEARQVADWNRAAAQMSVTANASQNRKPDKLFVPGDFMPANLKQVAAQAAAKTPAPRVNIRDLKHAFGF